MTDEEQVKCALFRCACGYQSEETTYRYVPSDETGEYEKVPDKAVKKEREPSVAALRLWLEHYGQTETKTTGGVVLMPDIGEA